MSYISSGQFREDIERVTGKTLVRGDASGDDDDDDDDVSLDPFEPTLRVELEALLDLYKHWSPPQLCELYWGDFCTVPDLTGDEREEVLEDWFEGDEAATDVVMRAIDVLNGSGFYIVVDTDGRLGCVCEDPYSFHALDSSLPQLLKALVAAHHAARTQGVKAAQAELLHAVDARTAKLMLTFAGRLAPSAKD